MPETEAVCFFPPACANRETHPPAGPLWSLPSTPVCASGTWAEAQVTSPDTFKWRLAVSKGSGAAWEGWFCSHPNPEFPASLSGLGSDPTLDGKCPGTGAELEHSGRPWLV